MAFIVISYRQAEEVAYDFKYCEFFENRNDADDFINMMKMSRDAYRMRRLGYIEGYVDGIPAEFLTSANFANYFPENELKYIFDSELWYKDNKIDPPAPDHIKYGVIKGEIRNKMKQTMKNKTSGNLLIPNFPGKNPKLMFDEMEVIEVNDIQKIPKA